MERRFYRINEIASYLGVQPDTIRKWIRQGKLPFRKLNGAIRFDINEINKWVDKNKPRFLSC